MKDHEKFKSAFGSTEAVAPFIEKREDEFTSSKIYSEGNDRHVRAMSPVGRRNEMKMNNFNKVKEKK